MLLHKLVLLAVLSAVSQLTFGRAVIPELVPRDALEPVAKITDLVGRDALAAGPLPDRESLAIRHLVALEKRAQQTPSNPDRKVPVRKILLTLALIGGVMVIVGVCMEAVLVSLVNWIAFYGAWLVCAGLPFEVPFTVYELWE
ncbi:hypothetical protein CERZMDRAFT_103502 [Cercospora zeae-maydis SCOH1-5]|uniref:Uncharacterized protein n=1 Tax=Cercospora zeae-maydis SCOH1-5 TaxID=717836 RepID=A0A6A6EVK8_9PEZI|nr:hypothetical protein CERZMDRAFT_103502 [Cercospora zeae-maydis SCOH1-5]